VLQKFHACTQPGTPNQPALPAQTESVICGCRNVGMHAVAGLQINGPTHQCGTAAAAPLPATGWPASWPSGTAAAAGRPAQGRGNQAIGMIMQTGHAPYIDAVHCTVGPSRSLASLLEQQRAATTAHLCSRLVPRLLPAAGRRLQVAALH
jgi:hypothetical protein